MTNFEQRLEKGKILYTSVKEFLKNNKISYFETGYESLISSNEAMGLIKTNNDKTSKFIRYYPDLSIVFANRAFLLEVKNSSGIEKECYLNCLILANNLKIDVLICNKFLKICKIQELAFIKMKEFDKIAKINIPVTDGIWKEPRLMNKNDYIKYLTAYENKKKYTSGCSFAFIDFNNKRFLNIDVLKKYSKNLLIKNCINYPLKLTTNDKNYKQTIIEF